jgi:tmRNA-binding protein
LRKIGRMTKETGLTVVPTKMFIAENGWVKVVVAVAKGKKEYDKRETLKEKDDRRQIDRVMKVKIR